jgi:hypothetical protein
MNRLKHEHISKKLNNFEKIERFDQSYLFLKNAQKTLKSILVSIYNI